MKDSEVHLGVIGVGTIGAMHARSVRVGRAPGLRLAPRISRNPFDHDTSS